MLSLANNLHFHWKARCPEQLSVCHHLVHRKVTQFCDASYWTEAFSSEAFIYSLPGDRKKKKTSARLCGIQNECGVQDEKKIISLSANSDIVRGITARPWMEERKRKTTMLWSLTCNRFIL